MTADHALVEGLVGLDARAWAQLLRAVRVLAHHSGAVVAALDRPTGELAGGSPRRELCTAIAASDELLALLRDDAALPAAVHAAITSPSVEEVADEGDRVDAGRRDRSDERLRALRRSLEEERRRREGAEVRAATAETNVQEATVERESLRDRIATLEAELAAAHDAVAQAAARAERRSGSRADALERELSAERSELESLRREHERSRAEVAALREEIHGLRSQVARPAIAPSPGGVRPLALPDGLDAGTTEAARWFAERATTLIVDGYNATLTLRPDRTLEDQRRWLVERLRPLANRRAIRPVIIFDGDDAAGRMRGTGGVEVRFSAAGVTADDEIVFAVAATDEPVVVVTDDAELRARVLAEGGNVVGVVHLLGVVDG